MREHVPTVGAQGGREPATLPHLHGALRCLALLGRSPTAETRVGAALRLAHCTAAHGDIHVRGQHVRLVRHQIADLVEAQAA